MDIPEEPGAVLASILVVALFLFLLALGRGSLSERKQTGLWIAATLLFFSVCGLLRR
jgi:hypothetical protein